MVQYKLNVRFNTYEKPRVKQDPGLLNVQAFVMAGLAIYGPRAKEGPHLLSYSLWTKNGFAFLYSREKKKNKYFMTHEILYELPIQGP